MEVRRSSSSAGVFLLVPILYIPFIDSMPESARTAIDEVLPCRRAATATRAGLPASVVAKLMAVSEGVIAKSARPAATCRAGVSPLHAGSSGVRMVTSRPAAAKSPSSWAMKNPEWLVFGVQSRQSVREAFADMLELSVLYAQAVVTASNLRECPL